MEVSIIVPVYNRSDLTQNFIRNVSPYLWEESELIIVDNASTDDTHPFLEFASKTNKRIKYFKSEKNLGFSGGNNLGARHSKGKTLIFTSNDVEFKENFVEQVKRQIVGRKKSIFGTRLINFNTGWNIFKELSDPVPYLEGWFIVMRREDYDLLGGWDETYFLDYEDVSLSFHAVREGYDLQQLEINCHHLGGQTAYTQLPETRLKHTLESIEKFSKKFGLTRVV